MMFIALLAALLVIQYWDSARLLHRDQWFDVVLAKLLGLSLPPALVLALLVLAPALLLFWLLMPLQELWFGLPGLVLTILVLLYSFGRGNYQETVSEYRRHCQSGDFEAAYLLAGERFPRQHGDVDPEDALQLHRWMRKRLLYMGFERWFAVVFYFGLFGAAGALAYRLCQLGVERVEAARNDGGEEENGAGEAEQTDLAARLLHILDWVPTRLLAFSFTLTGDYLGGRERALSAVQDLDSPAEVVLDDVACAALGTRSEPESGSAGETWDLELGQLHSLMSRSAMAWVFLFALLVVFI